MVKSQPENIFWYIDISEPKYLNPKSRKKISQRISAVLSEMQLSDNFCLEINIVSDQKMQALNQEYRKYDCSTDVLSFPTYIELDQTKKQQFLGAIYISPTFVDKYAQADQKLPEDILESLVLHGLLHLLGFDHEKDLQTWKNIQKKCNIEQ